MQGCVGPQTVSASLSPFAASADHVPLQIISYVPFSCPLV
jgi:hypothetical protein